MKIEFELADDMRRELKDATARELENACEELEDEIAALAALPAADIKNYHGVWGSQAKTKQRKTQKPMWLRRTTKKSCWTSFTNS